MAAGLIGGYVSNPWGEGLGDVGKMMMYAGLKDEDREDRDRYYRDRLAAAAALQESKNEAAMARVEARLEATRGSGGGSGGKGSGPDGIPIGDLERGGRARGLLLERTGLTEDQLTAVEDYMRGNGERLKKDTQYGERQSVAPDDDPTLAKNSPVREYTKREYPPGFEAEARDKAHMIGQIRQSLVLGSKADDVAKGEQTTLGTDLARGVVAGTQNPETAAQAIGVTKGEGAYKQGGNTVYNQYSGDAETTEVGESVIDRNTKQGAAAQARAARGPATKEPAADKPITGVDLERQAKAARSALADGLGVASTKVEEQYAKLKRRGQVTPEIEELHSAYTSALTRWQKYKVPEAPTAPPAVSPSSRKDYSNLWK